MKEDKVTEEVMQGIGIFIERRSLVIWGFILEGLADIYYVFLLFKLKLNN